MTLYLDTSSLVKLLRHQPGTETVRKLVKDATIVVTSLISTYRAVYTVRFTRAVYVLHVFQKKSTKGIATPKADVDLVKRRLQLAERHYELVYR